jgi:hypothetical protein
MISRAEPDRSPTRRMKGAAKCDNMTSPVHLKCSFGSAALRIGHGFAPKQGRKLSGAGHRHSSPFEMAGGGDASFRLQSGLADPIFGRTGMAETS